ncbi:hypothetical protein MCOR07_011043, partial [Pyricularia oryzae]
MARRFVWLRFRVGFGIRRSRIVRAGISAAVTYLASSVYAPVGDRAGFCDGGPWAIVRRSSDLTSEADEVADRSPGSDHQGQWRADGIT